MPVNPSTVRVNWRYVAPTIEEEPLIGYKVRVWESDQDMSTANDTAVRLGRKLEAYVTGLTFGKRYNLRVMAYSQGGDGKMSSPTWVFRMGELHCLPFLLLSNKLGVHPVIRTFSVIESLLVNFRRRRRQLFLQLLESG